MQGKASAAGKRVALISQEDYYETPCVAEFLSEQGKQVEVFHKSLHLGTEIARYSIGMVARRMEDCGVTVHPNLILTRVQADGLEFVSSYGGIPIARTGSIAWSWCTGGATTRAVRPAQGRGEHLAALSGRRGLDPAPYGGVDRAWCHDRVGDLTAR